MPSIKLLCILSLNPFSFLMKNIIFFVSFVWKYYPFILWLSLSFHFSAYGIDVSSLPNQKMQTEVSVSSRKDKIFLKVLWLWVLFLSGIRVSDGKKGGSIEDWWLGQQLPLAATMSAGDVDLVAVLSKFQSMRMILSTVLTTTGVSATGENNYPRRKTILLIRSKFCTPLLSIISLSLSKV